MSELRARGRAVISQRFSEAGFRDHAASSSCRSTADRVVSPPVHTGGERLRVRDRRDRWQPGHGDCGRHGSHGNGLAHWGADRRSRRSGGHTRAALRRPCSEPGLWRFGLQRGVHRDDVLRAARTRRRVHAQRAARSIAPGRAQGARHPTAIAPDGSRPPSPASLVSLTARQ